MKGLPERLAVAIIERLPQGVVICNALEPDYHVVYVNAAMERLTGYGAADFIGRNMRFLQGEDREQEGLARIRRALAAGANCQAMVRNYRHDGTLFWNEISLEPLHDASGRLTHYVSFHRDAGERTRMTTRADGPAGPGLGVVREDKLTGLLRREYFEEVLKRDWGLAQREMRRLTLIVFELDAFQSYRDVFGPAGAEQTVRRVARLIGGNFRRASDLCGRFDEDKIVALANGMTTEQARLHATNVIARVHELAIHHPRSPVSRFVTMTAGVATLVPAREDAPQRLIDATVEVLTAALGEGGNRVAAREL
ncbi:MAG TPA: diguanylate cyclase [Steroidobacteraceae bacterium]|nr:diguanylate cyclase [Steroidobacteraceae bacterium]